MHTLLLHIQNVCPAMFNNKYVNYFCLKFSKVNIHVCTHNYNSAKIARNYGDF